MAKAKRLVARKRQEMINSFVQFVEDSYHGIVAVYHRKTGSIIVYPKTGYIGLNASDAQEILTMFLSGMPEGTSITFSGAKRDQTTYLVAKARETGEIKKYRCIGCGGRVNRGGKCQC